MEKVKAYYFDDCEFEDKLKETFPANLMGEVSGNAYSEEKVLALLELAKSTIENPKSREAVLNTLEKENITCLPDKVKDKILSLFDDPDILIYGHGGAAEEVLKSGRMKCKYANLESHFVPLSPTNQSLDNLNHWFHRDASQILIMGVNRREFNPVFRKEDEGYSISSDYFMGYYDRDKEEFVENPNFKKRHEYKEGKPDIELHIGEYWANGIYAEDEEFNQVLRNLENINLIMVVSKYVPLNKEGIEDVSRQVSYFIKDTGNRISNMKKENKVKINT